MWNFEVKSLNVLLVLFLNLQSYSSGSDTEILSGHISAGSSNAKVMELKITIANKTATGILYHNPASRDFAKLLPLTLTLQDYNGTEKIYDLPEKLAVKDAPAGFKPTCGDIAYYAPWGNLAVFYKDFAYSTGLISLGKITSGVEAFNVNGPVTVKIEINQ